MNWKKHEGSLLKVFSDAGSTPAASTTNHSAYFQDLNESFAAINKCGDSDSVLAASVDSAKELLSNLYVEKFELPLVLFSGFHPVLSYLFDALSSNAVRLLSQNIRIVGKGIEVFAQRPDGTTRIFCAAFPDQRPRTFQPFSM